MTRVPLRPRCSTAIALILPLLLFPFLLFISGLILWGLVIVMVDSGFDFFRLPQNIVLCMLTAAAVVMAYLPCRAAYQRIRWIFEAVNEPKRVDNATPSKNDDVANRVSLRDVVDDDLPLFFEFQLDDQACWMAAFVQRDPKDHDAFEAHWARIRADNTVVIRTILFGGQVVGHVARYVRDGHPEVTYWIGKPFWGKGIASAALAMFLEDVTERPIFAGAAGDNVASLRVLQKCGFVIVGCQRGFAKARGEDIDETMLKLT